MIIKYIKNKDVNTNEWCGMTFSPNEVREIVQSKWIKFANDNSFIQALIDGNAVISNGVYEITDIASALKFLVAAVDIMTKDDEGKIKISTPQRDDGKIVVHSSSKPIGTTTYFTSRFDNIQEGSEEIAGGNSMKVSLTENDDECSVTGEFLHDVWIKDGLIKYETAPDGATVSMQIICPLGMYYHKDVENNIPCASDNAKAVLAQATEDKIISQFVCNVDIYKTNLIGEPFNTEDEARIPKGYKIKLIVKNGSTKSAFKVWTRIEFYREYTII